MNKLPNIPGVVGNYSLNGTLSDSSGNSPDWASVDQYTEVARAPTWVSFDGCTQAVDLTYYDSTHNAKLMADAPLLRFAGPFTIQWTMVQLRTFNSPYFTCCNPAGRSDGIAPDRIGSLYSFFWSGSGKASIADQNIGSTLPFAFYGDFAGTDNASWGQVPVSPPPYAAPVDFALTRDTCGNYHAYRRGTLISSVLWYSLFSPNVSAGNERSYIGGLESGVPPSGSYGGAGCIQIANVRYLNYERSAAQIAADSAFVMAPCGLATAPLTNASGGVGLVGPAVTAELYREAPKAYGDQYRNPGQGETS